MSSETLPLSVGYFAPPIGDSSRSQRFPVRRGKCEPLGKQVRRLAAAAVIDLFPFGHWQYMIDTCPSLGAGK
jgi:hypothetical protein